MKSYICLYMFLLSILILNSCKDNKLEPLVNDGVAPGKVEITSVTSIAGGLEVKYNLPKDEDLLYVKAVYTLTSGKISEAISSYYENKMTIRGFGDTAVHSIQLFAVDRGENMSEPVSFTGKALLAPVRVAQKSLKIQPDFGGARFTWANATSAPLMIMLYATDTLGKFRLFQTVYTSEATGRYNIRGLKSVPTKFAAIVRDRWDNYSDSILPDGLLIPLYEQRLNKLLMKKVVLANDENWDQYGFKLENIFDDDLTTVAHTLGGHPFPQIMTIDLGVKVKLSRFKCYMRGPNNDVGFLYTHGNPKEYDVYGLLDLPVDNSGDLSQWIKLRDKCISVKPVNADEARVHGLDGDEYDFDQANFPTEIRYFRFAVTKTWDAATFINVNELSFWGNIDQSSK